MGPAGEPETHLTRRGQPGNASRGKWLWAVHQQDPERGWNLAQRWGDSGRHTVNTIHALVGLTLLLETAK